MSKIKAIEKFIGNLPKDVRIHISNKPITKLRSLSQKNGEFKPTGLWYDCNKEWMNWIGSESPDWVADYIYLVRINKSKILRLKSEDDVRNFNEMYGFDKYGHGGNNEVNWARVASKYAGIEICPYQHGLRMNRETGWYYAWDIASGCIWNPAGISLQFVGLWDDKSGEVVGKDEIIEMEEDVKSGDPDPLQKWRDKYNMKKHTSEEELMEWVMNLKRDMKAGLEQPLSRRREYGSAEEGSMLQQLERMHDADRIALASDMTKIAKSLVAIRPSPGQDDPYSDDEKRQILNKIPQFQGKLQMEADEAIRYAGQAEEAAERMWEHLADLVWIYGSSNDKRLRRAEMMLKALEKHTKTLKEIQPYLGRIAKFVK